MASLGAMLTPEEDARGLNPAPTSRRWRDRVLPRSILPLAWAMWPVLLPARIAGWRERRANARRPRAVAIESGIVGWTHVYFEELERSAQERFGTDAVARHVIDRDQPYLPQLRANLARTRPTHVVLDVRTPGQSWRRSLPEAVGAAWMLLRRGIVPVVVLTDACYRRQRWHAGVLTLHRGVAVTFAARSIIRSAFPHRRIIGPLFMPVSAERVAWLERRREARAIRDAPRIQFIGSAYPPRDRFLAECGRLLAERGLELTVSTDKAGTSNDRYWATLVDADIVLTTTMQGPSRPFMDWIWVQQAVFRYAEALAAGATLVAAPVDGGFGWLVEGRDYVGFESVTGAADAIARLAADPGRRSAIARAGHATVRGLAGSGAFWDAVEAGLSGRVSGPGVDEPAEPRDLEREPTR